MRDPRARRQVPADERVVLGAFEDREDRVRGRAIDELATDEAQQERRELPRRRDVVEAAIRGLEVEHLPAQLRPDAAPLPHPLGDAFHAEPLHEPVRRRVVADDRHQRGVVADRRVGHAAHPPKHPGARQVLAHGDPFVERQPPLGRVGIDGHEDRDLDHRRGREGLVRLALV